MKYLVLISALILVLYNVTSVIAEELKSPEYVISQEKISLQDSSEIDTPSNLNSILDKNGYVILNKYQGNYERPLKLNSHDTDLISLSPALSDIIIKPGVSVRLKYIVENKKDPIIITLALIRLDPAKSPLDFTINKDLAGPVTFNWEDRTDNMPQSFLLDTKEKRAVNLTLSVKEHSQPRSYYYGLAAKIIDLSFSNRHTSVRNEPEIVSPILLSVSPDGDIQNNLSVVDLGLEKGVIFIDSFDTPTVSAIVNNSGIYHSQFKGKLSLSSFLGKTTFNLEPFIVFPHTSRSAYPVKLPRFLIGKQEISLQHKSRVFFAIPVKFSLIVLTLMFTYYFFIIRKR